MSGCCSIGTYIKEYDFLLFSGPMHTLEKGEKKERGPRGPGHIRRERRRSLIDPYAAPRPPIYITCATSLPVLLLLLCVPPWRHPSEWAPHRPAPGSPARAHPLPEFHNLTLPGGATQTIVGESVSSSFFLSHYRKKKKRGRRLELIPSIMLSSPFGNE